MKQIVKLLVVGSLLVCGYGSVAVAQDNSFNTNEGDLSSRLLRELQATRQLVEGLRRDLLQVQILAVQIRTQQDLIAGAESRLDGIRTEIHSSEERVVELRDRISQLESTDASKLEQAEEQRIQADLKDAKKEVERQQLRVDLLKSQEAELAPELHAHRSRLDQMLTRLNQLGLPSIESKAQSTAGDAKRSPGN